MIRSHPESRTSFEGQTTHENTTVSLLSALTAMGNDVISPSGTSLPPRLNNL